MSLIELNFSGGESEESKVFTEPDIATGMILGTALAKNYVTSKYGFPAKFLDPKSFAVAVSAVSGSALSFFVRHGGISCWITLN
jgi:hypothetical protein